MVKRKGTRAMLDRDRRLVRVSEQVPPIVIQVDDDATKRLPISSWYGILEETWSEMPARAQATAGNLIKNVIVVHPDDTRLPQGVDAALYGEALVLSCEADPEEIWHEIGHVIADRGLTSNEQKALDRFYNFKEEQRAPPEVLAEDFYFTVRGDTISPFWRWWFSGSDLEEMQQEGSNKMSKRVAGGPNSLQVVEAALEAFADLIYEADDERLVWFYGIAQDALREAQTESRLSYEDRGGTHQYYYHEDLSRERVPSRKGPMSQPLRVERPDVTMRGHEPTAPGPGIM